MSRAQINRNRLQAFSKLELIARQVVEGFITGLHKSPFHGFSVEFAEHRLYNSGESTRHIDWKLYGKTDKLFVKRFEEETNLRCQIVIDTSSSMFFPFPKAPSLETPNKMVFAVYAAAAIIEMLKRQRDAYGLSLFDEDIQLQTPARSNVAHQHLIYDNLEQLLEVHNTEQKQQTRLGKALHQIAESIHKRSLIIIFSDMFEDTENTDELFSALQHLKHNKHEVILFHTVDKKSEIDFDYQNRPYKFIDAESGEILKLNPKDIKEQYIKQINQFTKELKLRCGQFKIDFVEADINKGFEQILTPYLLKRQKMM
jgi:uncharacterized protein (DUF58 family)